jgi:hypothetical protein
MILKLSLALELQVPMAGAAGDNDGLGFHCFPIDQQTKRSALQLDSFEDAELNPSAEAFRLFLQAGHELVAIDTLWKSRKILHHRGCRQKAARLAPRQH